MKAHQIGRMTLTTLEESGDEMAVSIDFDGAYGPIDALRAEIAFLFAASQTQEAVASVD